MDQIKTLKVREITEGTVVKVEHNTIYLDVQYFTEAKMHLDNYGEQIDSFIGVVNVGDVIEGKIQKIDEANSLILMSRLPLQKEENFNKLAKIVEDKEVVKAKVKKAVDKGLLLEYLDYEVFLPYTLLDYELVEQKETLNGKILEINILEATRRGRFTRIIGSRKEIFEKNRKAAYNARMKERQDQLDKIQTGDVLTGKIDKVEKHAANVRFDKVVALLRISQVSHYKIDQLDDILKVGQEVEVKVIKKEGNRLDLSMKALIPTPFAQFTANVKVGDTVTGTINQKLPFGLIVEVEKDVRGLLHKNEYSWNPNDNYDSFVKIGDEVTLKVASIDKKNEKISLSRKALENNPWDNVTLKRGDLTKVVITKVDNKGLTVEVQGVDGFISANDALAEGTGQVESFFSVGDSVEALVTDVNVRNWNLRLSIRKIQERKDRESFEKYLEDDSEDVGQTIGDLFADELK